MSLEKDISQQRFRSENQKTAVNLIYTFHWLTEKIKEIIGDEGLTMQQYNILRILKGSDPEPLSTLQIRDRMLDKMSDTSRIVDRLLAKGYVSKKISKTDKRLVEVKITAKGKNLLAKLDKRNKQMDEVT
jgi:DNA-binding MarR family transcriptional regulator